MNHATKDPYSVTNAYKKRNYWISQENLNPTPWYKWDVPVPKSRSKSETVQERPSRSSPRYENFNKDLREYLSTSTLHGLRYVGERKLTWFERFFWLVAFISSFICAGYFILNVYAKWRLSPMIVSINPMNMPLRDIPFPALTICNTNQAKKTIAEQYKNFGSSVDKKLLESLCSSQADVDLFEEELAESADWDHTRSFLINVTQPCNEMLARCIWDSTDKSCQDLFNAQLTDEGLCCTFNAVHREKLFRNPRALNDLNLTFPSPAVDWTAEQGYPADAPADGFPWKPKGIGTDHGLTLVLDVNIAEYYCASTKSTGFKILLHNPTETPKIAKLGEIYGPGIEVRAAIQPKILDAQPALRYMDIDKRHCLFSNEVELVYYRTYTLKNCQMECEARLMLDICSCVLYYMPKNKTMRVCGKADAKCYNNMRKYIPEGLERTCVECLPACTEISYVERLSSAPLNKALFGQYAQYLTNKTPDYFVNNMLVIHFYFEDNAFLRYTKGEIFGLTEFLSNTGGLLGLCMGFSVMSAVELFYYLTLRALCSWRRRRAARPFLE